MFVQLHPMRQQVQHQPGSVMHPGERLPRSGNLQYHSRVLRRRHAVRDLDGRLFARQQHLVFDIERLPASGNMPGCLLPRGRYMPPERSLQRYRSVLHGHGVRGMSEHRVLLDRYYASVHRQLNLPGSAWKLFDSHRHTLFQ